MRRRLLAIACSCALAASCGAKEEPAEVPAAEAHGAEAVSVQPTLEQVAAEARAAAEAPASAPIAIEQPAPASGEPVEADAADHSGHTEPAAADAPPAH